MTKTRTKPAEADPKGDKDEVAFTMRLNRSLHRRLVIYALDERTTSKDVMHKALTAYLDAKETKAR